MNKKQGQRSMFNKRFIVSSFFLIFIFVSLFFVTSTQATTGSYTWTTKEDFENNASTVGTPTTRTSVDTEINPGNVVLSKSTEFFYYGTLLDDKYTTDVLTAYNKLYIAEDSKLHVFDNSGIKLTEIVLPSSVVDLTYGNNTIFIALSNGKAVKVNSFTDTLEAGEIDLYTINGSVEYVPVRIFYNSLDNQLIAAYYDKSTTYGSFVGVIDLFSGSLVRRITVTNTYKDTKFSYDYDSIRNIVWAASYNGRFWKVATSSGILGTSSNRTGFNVKSVVIDEDQQWFYVFSGSQRLEVFNAALTFWAYPYAVNNYATSTQGVAYDDTNNRFFSSSGGQINIFKLEPQSSTNIVSVGNFYAPGGGGNKLSVEPEGKYFTWDYQTSLGVGFGGSNFGTKGTIVLTANNPSSATTKWSNLLFEMTLPENNYIKFRTKSADSSEILSSEEWSSWYYANQPEAFLYLYEIIGQGNWLQIELQLIGSGSFSPTLSSLSIGYDDVQTAPREGNNNCSQSNCHQGTAYPTDNFDEGFILQPMQYDRCSKCHNVMFQSWHIGYHQDVAKNIFDGLFGGFNSINPKYDAHDTAYPHDVRNSAYGIPSLISPLHSQDDVAGCNRCHHAASAEECFSGCHEGKPQGEWPAGEPAIGTSCEQCHRQVQCKECHGNIRHARHNNPTSPEPTCTDGNCHNAFNALVKQPDCKNCHYRDKTDRIDQYIDKTAHGDIQEKHRVTDQICSGCHGNFINDYHVARKDSNGNQITCATCHKSTRPEVIFSIRQNETFCKANCHPSAGHGFTPPEDVPRYTEDGFMWSTPVKASQWNGESWVPDAYLNSHYVIFTNHSTAGDGEAIFNWYIAKLVENGWTAVPGQSSYSDNNNWHLVYSKDDREIIVNFYNTESHLPGSPVLSTGPRIELLYK